MVFTIKKWHDERYLSRLEVKCTKDHVGWGQSLVDKTTWKMGAVSGSQLVLHRDGWLLMLHMSGEYEIYAKTANMCVQGIEAIHT